MTPIGGLVPVHHSNCSLRLRHQHLQAADRLAAHLARPRAAAASPAGCRPGRRRIVRSAARRAIGVCVHVRVHADRRAVDQQIPAAALGRPRSDRRPASARPISSRLAAIAGVHADRAPLDASATSDGPRGAAGAEHRHARMPRSGTRSCSGSGNRCASVLPPSQRSVDHADRVDRADAARHRIHFVDAIEHRHLERDRHAGAVDAERAAERHEVVGVDGRKRQVDGVEPRRRNAALCIAGDTECATGRRRCRRFAVAAVMLRKW